MEDIDCNKTLTNPYNLLPDFFTVLDNHDIPVTKEVIYSKEEIGLSRHKTLLTFRHNLKAVLAFFIPMAVLNASTTK